MGRGRKVSALLALAPIGVGLSLAFTNCSGDFSQKQFFLRSQSVMSASSSQMANETRPDGDGSGGSGHPTGSTDVTGDVVGNGSGEQTRPPTPVTPTLPGVPLPTPGPTADPGPMPDPKPLGTPVPTTTPLLDPTPEATSTPSSTPTPTPPPRPSATPPLGSILIDESVKYMCSDHLAEQQSFSITTSTDPLKLVVTRSDDTSVCEISGDGIRAKLINEKRFDQTIMKSQCPNLTAGSYKMYLVKQSAMSPLGPVSILSNTVETNPLFLKSARAGVPVTVVNETFSSLRITAPVKLWVLYSTVKWVNKNKSKDSKDVCDEKQSPLVIQLAPRHRPAVPLTLSAPLDGIWFDIYGARNSYRQNRISWLTRESTVDNYFLALPNARGEVRGIDELFGNNTRGPDGRFAANGFEALRKFDRNGDGHIDRRDPVFSRLRMWSDRDVDGKAQASELFTLEELGLMSIDLNYDPNYIERDKYGNEVKLKSVAFTRDGRPHVVYDVWFRVLP
jgi:hypothetical protein